MNASELRETAAAYVESMDAAVRAAGIAPDEPLAPVLAEWRRSLAWSGELVARMAEIDEKLEDRLVVASVGGVLDAPALAKISHAAANGAAQRVEALSRSINRRTTMVAALGCLIAILVGAVSGYVVGRSSAVATVTAVEAAAVRDGPEAAQMWARLMTANDGALVARTCKETGARSDGGRHACVLGLWTEPPINVPPRTGPAGK